jgi:hypothetical protein
MWIIKLGLERGYTVIVFSLLLIAPKVFLQPDADANGAISKISTGAQTGIKQFLPGTTPLVLSYNAAAVPSPQERSYLPTSERSGRRHSCGWLN